MEENRQRRFTDTAYIQKQITADKDGKTLRGDLFLPFPAEGKYPLVICSHVLGAKRHTMHKYCRIFASHGAAAVCFDFGGCGESDGDPLQMSLLTEAEDLKTIISSACEWDFVKRDMIILLGESQGGAASAISAAEMKEYVKGMILCFPALNIPDVFEELYPDPSSVPDSFYFRWLTLGKKYAEDVIPVIRENDPDAVIIVGTPTWSQDVDIAADNPLKFDNVMYTLHFYASTHKDSYRDKLKTAISKGLPVLVTEYGLSEASGDGNIDTAEAKKWLDMLDENGISYFAWSLSNKAESSALLKAGTGKKSGWGNSDLSKAGKWVFNQYKKRNGINSVSLPGKVSGLKVKNKKGRKLYLSWAPVSEADGYQVVYSTGKKFGRSKKKLVKGNSVTISKLKKKKTYYVKLRAYKKAGTSKRFGKYSAVKKIKIKK